MAEWIRVEDRLPEDSNDVLVYGDEVVSVGYKNRFTQSLTSYEFKDKQHITHWMPLPDAPNNKNDDLVKRQQSEIVRLMRECECYRLMWINAEHKAYLKFAALLKEQAAALPGYYDKVVTVEEIYNLLEELVNGDD